MIGAVLLAGAAWALPADLKTRVEAYDQAQIHGDVSTLEDILDRQYRALASSGRLQTKSDVIREYRAGSIRLEPFTVTEPFAVLSGDVAIVGGKSRLKGTIGKRPFDLELSFSDVWVKRRGLWRVIFTHAHRSSGSRN